MAQTFLNLAQGVTGTLPTSNYVDNGKVVKIHSTHPTNLSEQTFQTTSFTTVTGLSLTITPASSSSKFLLQTGLQYRLRSSSSNDQPNFAIRFQRDGSQIYKTNNYTFGIDINGTQTGSFLMGIAQFNYVDAPSTASQIVYSVGVRTETDGGADIVDINDDGGDGTFLYAIEFND